MHVISSPLKISTLIKKTSLVWLLLFINMTSAYASLLITPTRVEFDQRSRAAKVSIVNTGSETKTYKIFFRNQKQLPDGKYQHFTTEEEVANFNTADNMLRYSPRQVTLKPGERQHVRIAVRRPKDLANGEYRSHMVFEAVPNRKADEALPSGQSGIKLYVNLAFAIPVMIRQGEMDVQVAASNVKMLTKDVNGVTQTGAVISLVRQGMHSSFGNLKVLWKDTPEGEETQIGILNNIAIYSEVTSRDITIGLPKHSVKSGYLRILYEGRDEYKGTTFVDSVIPVSADSYIKSAE